MLAGATLDRARAAGAADAALKDARPLAHNAYKIAIARAVVRRTVLRAGQVQDPDSGK
jgi:xanthine dehydrogenase YagS FAD-binding subunit